MRADATAARQLLLALAAGALACAPTKPAVGPRLAFPFWTVGEVHPTTVGCAQLLVWISKTGKQGLGASIALTAPRGPCEVALTGARLEVAGRIVATAAVPPGLTVGQGEVVQNYLPFYFDNEAAWNHGERRGRLLLEVTGGAAHQVVEHRLFERVYPFAAEAIGPTPSGLTVTPIYPDRKPARP